MKILPRIRDPFEAFEHRPDGYAIRPKVLIFHGE
jgi:hypothetical protein